MFQNILFLDVLPLECGGLTLKSLLLVGLPGVRYLTGQSSFLVICPVKNMTLNRTISCPVFGRPGKLHEIWSVDSE